MQRKILLPLAALMVVAAALLVFKVLPGDGAERGAALQPTPLPFRPAPGAPTPGPTMTPIPPPPSDAQLISADRAREIALRGDNVDAGSVSVKLEHTGVCLLPSP